jgi:two-component system sensor histidine kinase/response regulator
MAATGEPDGDTPRIRALQARVCELEMAMAAGQETALALSLSEERYALAVRGSNDGIWDWDIPSNNVAFSPRFKELLGYEPDEFADRFDAFSTRLHPEDFDATMAAVKAHLEQGHPYDVEYRLRHRDGDFRWFRARGLAIRDKEGKALRMAGSITDVTEGKSAAEKIQAISDRLVVATKAGAIGIWDFDVINNGLIWDERMYQLYGITPDAFSGAYEAWESGLHPADLPQEREKIQRALRGQEDFNTEFRVVWPDGSVRFIKANAIVQRDATGQPVRMIGTNWDITERKLAEDELRLAKQNAEAAARAKSEFLANMSHEIRTPMNGIMGMTELLLDSELNPTQREFLMIVKNSSESLLGVINDILDFSKIEAGRLALDHYPFHLRDGVGDTLHSLSVRATEKAVELAYRIDPLVPDYLAGDIKRLQQVLVNLVGNAIKFTKNGEVVVSVGIESRTVDGVSLHFQVKDTGIGIPVEKLSVIFDPFTQAESTTSRRFGGTGLGLAIARQLIALMKGRLWVESKPDVGSTFHFTVLLGLETIPDAMKHSIPDGLAGLRVLVVDDHLTNRTILEEMLLSWEMSPTMAESGAEALRLIFDDSGPHRFDLIVLDYMMPDMDGVRTAEAIQRGLGAKTPPIILLSSAGAFHEPESRLHEIGITRRITKPAKSSDLLDAITQIMGSASRDTKAVAVSISKRPPEVPRMRVLLAEDGRVNQMVATNLLEHRGHEVTLAENGKLAFALVQEQKFDAVLMDVQMPEMNGYEATSAIRQWEASHGGHLPIIAMTANAMRGDREQCLAAGMDDYIAKPVRSAELFSTLEKFASIPGEDQETAGGEVAEASDV